MISRLWTAFLLSLACASVIAWLVALMHEKNVRPVQDLVAFFKKQSKAGRVILGTFFIVMWVIASTKPGDGGGNGGGEGGGGDGGTNNIQMVIGPGGGLQPLVSPGAVTNSQQQGLQGGILPPQGGLVGLARLVEEQRRDEQHEEQLGLQVDTDGLQRKRSDDDAERNLNQRRGDFGHELIDDGGNQHRQSQEHYQFECRHKVT